MSERLRWGNDAIAIELHWSDDEAPRLAEVTSRGSRLVMPAGLPLIEILTASHGHIPASDRLVHTVIGVESRYVGHEQVDDGSCRTLRVRTRHAPTGLSAQLELTAPTGVAALRSQVTLSNDGTQDVLLRSAASFSAYLGGRSEGDAALAPWSIHHARSDWLAESRWGATELPGELFPDIAASLTGHNPRGEFSVVSTGTWSTGRHLPVGVAASPSQGAAWGWEIEHNGSWRWEIGSDAPAAYLSLGGPTDTDHGWLVRLKPGETFTTVPVTVTVASDFETVIAELTGFRRAMRRPHRDNAAMTLVFNDYMNTLNGDPTAERLEPLIDAAAAAGAETFCIDAGWYDDNGDWWDSVGAWQPSTSRFPAGLGRITSRIRDLGMTPGLWLEPEVVGVKSPVAELLPREAFLLRGGERIVEHNRYHLDLRHPAARAHLDSVVDRLVDEFGIGYFKLDYNINPGSGGGDAVQSPGAALLDHNRAHLAWIDGVLTRHPELVLENCASGAMRADSAMLSRMQLQSTSDQQDFAKYPPIAASAPAGILPEQSANWAYPQPEMTPEQIAFCLVTGLAGRFYLSGHLNRMSPEQLELVREAVALAGSLKAVVATSTPFWPLGLPGWNDPWIALGLDSPHGRYLAVWSRDPDDVSTGLALAEGDSLEQIFPRSLPEWTTRVDPESGTLRVHNPTGLVGARLFRVTAAPSEAARPTPATRTP